jgi:cytoskeletal protein CcmA (bactofilin family)
MLFLCFAGNISAQKIPKIKVIKPGDLEIFGNVKGEVNSKGDNKNLGNVKIAVFKDDAKVNDYVTNASGRFDMKLDLNQIYTLYVSKENYITKILTITTMVPDSSQLPYEYQYKFNVILLEDFKGSAQMESLKRPAVKILFNEKFQDFDFDEVYNREVQAEMKLLQESIQQRIEIDNKSKIDSLIRGKIVADSTAIIKAKQDSINKTKRDSIGMVSIQKEYRSQQYIQDSLDRIERQRREDLERHKLDSIMAARNKDSIAYAIKNPPSKNPVDTTKKKLKDTTKPVVDKQKPTSNLPKFVEKNYPEGITEETYKEKGRIITREVVKKNGVQISYVKIVYDWGGVFYFKDELSMSSSSYSQEIESAKKYFDSKNNK